MRRPQELPKGQIITQAKGINAFLAPKDRKLAQPNQPSMLPNPTQVTTVSTGGTAGLRTKNKFAQLAEDLQDFSPKLVKTAQALGLGYADDQMRRGEEAAREAASRALALNDGQMEAGEMVRASENRRVARKDPQAGQFMATLNPYFSMGYQRGMTKQAGIEASAGLPSYFAQKNLVDPIDYTSPDMGVGKLVQWQAEYTNQLSKKYGINAASPGFQKYFLPSIEKAREAYNQRFLDDRKVYFDKAAVSSTTAQLSALYRTSEQNGFVEYQGQRFYQAQTPDAFNLIRSSQANQLINSGVLTASLPGEASERSKDIHAGLLKEAYYRNDQSMIDFANNIQGNQRVLGGDGKAIIGPNGEPLTLNWGSEFGGSNIDQQIKYEEKGFQQRQRETLERAEGFDDQLLDVASQYPPGPQQAQAVNQFIDEYYNTVGRAAGVSRADLRKRSRDLVSTDDEIFYEQGGSRPADVFSERVANAQGDAFNAVQLRKEMYEVANTLPPKERGSFITSQSARIRQKENDQRSMSGYKGTRDAVIKQAVKARREQYYDYGKDLFGNPQTNREDIAESDRLQTNAYTARANALILKREAELKRPLTDAEARQMANAAIYGDQDLGITAYGQGVETGPGSVGALFPGSNKSSTPGVDSASGGGSNEGAGLSDLSGVEKSVLENYKSQAVLSEQGTLDAYEAIQSSESLPPALDKAWRDAGARSAADFVIQQMNYWRRASATNGSPQTKIQQFSVPRGDKEKLLKRWKQAAAAGQTPVSYASSQQQAPALAAAGNWALNALTGATPAAAGTLPPDLRAAGNNANQRVVNPSGPVALAVESFPSAPELPPAPRQTASAPAPAPREQAVASRPTPPKAGRWVGTAAKPVGELKESKLRGFYNDEQGNLFRWEDPRSNIAGPRFQPQRMSRRLLGLNAPSTARQWSSTDRRSKSLVAMADRNGWDAADLAAIFSFETGGTFDPSQPGYGAAAGRVGLIQAGPNERRSYGLGSGVWEEEILAVERYLKGRGARPGMGLADLYATVNGGDPRAGYSPDGNGVVARSAETQRRLREHREAAIRKLRLRPASP